MNPPAVSKKSCVNKRTLAPAPPAHALRSSSMGAGNGGSARPYRRPASRGPAPAKLGAKAPSPAAQNATGNIRAFDASDKTISVKEAAFRLGKSQDAIYRWLRTGRLRGFQPGGHACSVLVLESSVEEARQCALGWLTAS